MGEFKLGPTATEQLNRFRRTFDQGEHGLITGPTGSGKTELASRIAQMRADRGGFVVSFVCKTKPDKTILESYLKNGWTRWTRWKKNPRVDERRIILWPDMSKMTLREAKGVMREEFTHALDEISRVGKWTVVIDEGLFLTDPRDGLGLGPTISTMYQLIRSAKGTMLTLAQRPSHLPLAIYANVNYAFVGQASNTEDARRLANLASTGAGINPRQLMAEINRNGKHDFLWIPVATGDPPERINLAK